MTDEYLRDILNGSDNSHQTLKDCIDKIILDERVRDSLAEQKFFTGKNLCNMISNSNCIPFTDKYNALHELHDMYAGLYGNDCDVVIYITNMIMEIQKIRLDFFRSEDDPECPFRFAILEEDHYGKINFVTHKSYKTLREAFEVLITLKGRRCFATIIGGSYEYISTSPRVTIMEDNIVISTNPGLTYDFTRDSYGFNNPFDIGDIVYDQVSDLFHIIINKRMDDNLCFSTIFHDGEKLSYSSVCLLDVAKVDKYPDEDSSEMSAMYRHLSKYASNDDLGRIIDALFNYDTLLNDVRESRKDI